MREIKFRAYVKPEHWMIRNLKGIFIEDWQDTIYIESVGFNPGSDGITIEQFTGLLDKNGKEIYEGDIVMFSLSKRKGVVSWYEDHYKIGGFEDWQEIHAALDIRSVQIYEVVGNIHENPELLEAKP